MKTLTPWGEGWGELILADGTPVWQTEEYGNAALTSALYDIGAEIVDAVLPNVSIDEREAAISQIQNEVFSWHPNKVEWRYDNPRMFVDVIDRVLEEWSTNEYFVAPTQNTVETWKRSVYFPAPLSGTAGSPFIEAQLNVTTTDSKKSVVPLIAAAVIGLYLLKK